MVNKEYYLQKGRFERDAPLYFLVLKLFYSCNMIVKIDMINVKLMGDFLGGQKDE